ncbi:NADP-dependent phosphogluconate dehydrogenase [Brevibacterium sp. UCMA 11754]|uniref:NADP-dependent phosphogluconate dehydrogenase n=1 Tax=Brevibacterium sp. UCMA 11754 TaxID=2749198 RepID=UPI001F19A1F7|nr:NADP-dependent phosphogluconate dehydrogenase [Brevibacterium sp. UCMA 11754]MCF2573260.1 NADP-dependent phosphogluconate dehydrogenase [Brevibacterium sp. UCMA 11754]
MTAEVGVIGTGVMGSNLARNLARNLTGRTGARVAIYDRDIDRARALAADHHEADFLVASSPADLASKLSGPRVAILMVNAGPATDSAIGDLLQVFEPGDIIVDGGNSLFTDTIARGENAAKAGIEFVGVGISGGEVGALEGPSMMVGGTESAWSRLRPILEPIAAHAEPIAARAEPIAARAEPGDGRSAQADPESCIAHVGTDGAGHFVKMIHNGIEYADMQLIAEAFALLRSRLGLTPPEIAEVFREWNRGDLESYLIEITAEVLDHTDAATGEPFVDIIADSAGAKGTGGWTVKTGLDLGVPVATIAEAVSARSLSAASVLRSSGAALVGPSTVTSALEEARESALEEARESALDDAPTSAPVDRDTVIETVRKALFTGKILAYVQGFHEIAAGAQEHGWNTELGEVARIWRAGCIIRARFLDRITEAFDADPNLSSLLAAPYFRDSLNSGQQALRDTVADAASSGVPIPALASALSYFDGIRTSRASAALVQGQRDFFGSHTYGRTDRPGTFHTLWSGDRSEVQL